MNLYIVNQTEHIPQGKMDGKQWNELIKKFITKTKVFQW